MKLYNWRNKEVKLVNRLTGEEVRKGDTIYFSKHGNSAGQSATLESIEPPHKPSASGKVNYYYASVFDLEFVEI